MVLQSPGIKDILNDISEYCVTQGSAVYMCSLDVEGAYDALPQAVLLLKAMKVLPDASWNILYTNMSVRITWNNNVGKPIVVERGTRQGGLSSPLLFNLFYENLVRHLNLMDPTVQFECYRAAENDRYRRFYIESHGLHFNPTKTECMVYGIVHYFVNRLQMNITAEF